jgi:hypothetical protein
VRISLTGYSLHGRLYLSVGHTVRRLDSVSIAGDMTVNISKRNRRIVSSKVLFQEIADAAEVVAGEEKSNFIRDTPFGEVRRGTFGITVKNAKGDELYKKTDEPFEYEVVNGFANVLKHAGAKLDENQEQFLTQALAGSNETGEAVRDLITMYNDRLKANAKSSAYASVVNRVKPLEGEDRETAVAKTIRGFVKLAGISVATAIEVLKAQKAVPEDYTEADYLATPLRRTKGDDDE